jgi:hypothetical protein
MSSPQASLQERLARLGSSVGEREAAHAESLGAARSQAEALHRVVADGVDAWSRAVTTAGAPYLTVELSEPRRDDKHIRAVELSLSRGRHRAIVTVKSRGEVTLVGPFRDGKTEGPCKSFPFDAESELHDALGDFLEAFLEDAATP